MAITRHRITVSLKEDVFKKLERERKKKKLSTYLNDFFEEFFGLGDKKKKNKILKNKLRNRKVLKGGIKNEKKI